MVHVRLSKDFPDIWSKLDIIVMGTITGAPLLLFCVLVTKA